MRAECWALAVPIAGAKMKILSSLLISFLNPCCISDSYLVSTRFLKKSRLQRSCVPPAFRFGGADFHFVFCCKISIGNRTQSIDRPILHYQSEHMLLFRLIEIQAPWGVKRRFIDFQKSGNTFLPQEFESFIVIRTLWATSGH